jgi:hypothetical protein
LRRAPAASTKEVRNGGSAPQPCQIKAGATIARALGIGILLFAGASVARADDWSTADTVRQGVLTGLLVADWAQTRWLVKYEGTPGHCSAVNLNLPDPCVSRSYSEVNGLLGEHPSTGKVNAYFAAAIVGHAAISYMLPRGWREGWQYVWIGVEANTVHHNRSLGIKLAF